jgi:hypothetical protein
VCEQRGPVLSELPGATKSPSREGSLVFAHHQSRATHMTII